jgi:hypothetical protein
MTGLQRRIAPLRSSEASCFGNPAGCRLFIENM